MQGQFHKSTQGQSYKPKVKVNPINLKVNFRISKITKNPPYQISEVIQDMKSQNPDNGTIIDNHEIKQ